MTAGRKGSKHPRRARASERRERWNAGGREEGEEAGEEKGRRGTTEEQQYFSPSRSPARTSAMIRRPSTVCQPDRDRTGRTRQNRLKSIPLFKSMQNPLRNDPFSVSIKAIGKLIFIGIPDPQKWRIVPPSPRLIFDFTPRHHHLHQRIFLKILYPYRQIPEYNLILRKHRSTT